MDLLDLLTDAEVESLTDLFVIHKGRCVEPDEHNDQILQAFLMGKMERDNK